MTLKELRECMKGIETLPDDMPVRIMSKRRGEIDIEEMVFNPYTQSIHLKEKK